MKIGITRLIMMAAIAALVLVAGSTAAWAQCPTSPNFTPDFSGVSNQACLTLNGNATFPTPAGSPATITAWSGSSGIVTFTASNSFTAGEPIILSGFANATFFNGLAFPVLSTGLSSSQFEIAFSGYTGASDTGTAMPLNPLQPTPNQLFQVGSAWYNTQQSVTIPFSTTFTFQLIGANTGYGPADGIAFVIQDSTEVNAQTGNPIALGDTGCGTGFGDDLSVGDCAPSTGGIPNSLAVVFKTFDDGIYYPNANSVSIQSNGVNPNCVDLSPCTIAVNDSLPAGITLADGNIHTVTITYTLQPTASSSPSCIVSGNPEPCLDVILDGNDLFSGGVPLILPVAGSTPVTLSTLIGGSNAWVGFTGGTGAGDDNQDILSWTFTPQAQSQPATVTVGTPAVYNYNGGFANGGTGYDYTGQLTSGSPVATLVTAIPIQDQPTCNAIVQANPAFNTAECFVYQNGGGQGIDSPEMFELTCPGSPTGGTCGSNGLPDFLATLGTDFTFFFGENPPLTANTFGLPNLTSSDGLPAVGFLKGAGPDPLHPCTPYPGNNPPLFQSNQIASFTLGDTSGAPVKAGSGGTGSCWLVTYQTPGEVPTVDITVPVNNQNYAQGAIVDSSYTCAAVNNGNSSTGPYLTTASCTGPVASGSPFSTSTPGPNTFTVTTVDSALNTSSETVTYNVQGSQTITFQTIPTQTYGVAPLALVATGPGGVVTFSVLSGPATVSGNTLTITGVGSVTVQASQAGNAYYALATATQTFTVNPANTTTTVTSSLNPSTYGQAVSFTANAGAGTTGTVQFAIDGSNFGSAITLSAGSATSGSISTLAAGTHTVTATYSGDADHAGSTGTLSGGQVVNQAPAITSANGVTFAVGVANSFTVTTTGLPTPSIVEGGALPSGVSFTNSGNGTGTLSGTPTVGGTFNITFTASNGVGSAAVQNFTLTVSGPMVSLSPTSTNFGTVYLYLDLNPVAVTVKNIGTSTVKISNVSLTLGSGTNSDDFLLINLCPSTLQVGQSCPVYVVFFAGNVGTPSATLNVTDNAPGSPQQASFSATVINPQVVFNPPGLNFGTIKAHSSSTQNVVLSNPGTTALTITSISVTGTNASEFVESSGCPISPSTLAPNKSCTIAVKFTPTGTGTASANLTVVDNAIIGTQNVPLLGKGD